MSKWISVDEPPKDSNWVVILIKALWDDDKGPNVEVAYYYEGAWHLGWGISDCYPSDDWEITHWMPLPEPPGEMTMFDQLTQNPETLAEFIRLAQSSDISEKWCNGDKYEVCIKKLYDGELICKGERYTECILDWLQSPAKEE